MKSVKYRKSMKIVSTIIVITLASLLIINLTPSHSKLSKIVDSKNTISLKTSKMQFDFDYTGGEQTFTAPYDGKYKLETWGAQGGTIINKINNNEYYGGYGAYSIGNINLKKDSILYINVGGKGKQCLNYGSTTAGEITCPNDGGYNGGGFTRQYTDSTYYGSGGGATHIATQSGLLYTLENSKNSILIVSGAGGGASAYSNVDYAANGGSAGGYVGSSGLIEKLDRLSNCTGGTENKAGTGTGSGASDGSFGHGADHTAYVGPGAGAGYYGGGTSEIVSCGGSGYIGKSSLTDKHMTCYNCETSNEESTKTISNTCASETPTPDCSKIGNGYARITYLGN